MLTALPLGLDLNLGEDMDVCKCIVHLQHEGTLNSHQAASREVGGRGTETVDEKLTQKILSEARKQLEDVEEEVGLSSICSKFQKSHLFVGLPEEKESADFPDKDNANFTGDGHAEEIEISEEDQKAFEKFMPEDPSKRATLADIIKDKLTEKQTEIQTIFSDVFPFSAPIGLGSFELLSLKRSHQFPHIPAQAPRALMSGYTLCFKTRCRHRIGSKQNTLLMRLL
ncbi:bystin [Trichonephila clavipes]|nr:bystin [Trichonephila clavipes]